MRLRYKICLISFAAVAFLIGFAARYQQIILDYEMCSASTYKEDGNKIASTKSDVDLQPIETLITVRKNLMEYYVDKLGAKEEGKMSHNAIRSMLASFKDPYTRYLNKDEYKIIENANEGLFNGIGAAFVIKQTKKAGQTTEHLLILSVLPGSSAEAAGLNSSDEILEIDGKSVLPFDPFVNVTKLINDVRNNRGDRKAIIKDVEREQKRIANGKSVYDAEKILSESSEKPLSLKIKTADGEEKTVKIQTKKLELEPIALDEKKGYIKINYMGEDTAEEFDKAMDKIAKDNPSKLTIDLRNVSGGEIATAQSIAKWFISGKTISILCMANEKEETVKALSKDGRRWNGNVNVLVNGGTANTAEVLATALRQNKKVNVVGDKTYGDLTMTMLFENPDKTGYILRTGEMKSPTNISIQGKGATIDMPVRRDK